MDTKASLSISVAQISTIPDAACVEGGKPAHGVTRSAAPALACGLQFRPVGRGPILIFVLPPPIDLISSVTVEVVLAVFWEARSLLSAVDAAARAEDSWA